MNRILGWLLGLDDVVSIDRIEPSWAAPWASNEYGPFWVVLAVSAAMAIAITFYLRGQNRGSKAARLGLGVARGLLLALLIATLAEPVLRLTTTTRQMPTVYVLFDGTDSMAIRDPMTVDAQAKLAEAVGLDASDAARDGARSGGAGGDNDASDGNANGPDGAGKDPQGGSNAAGTSATGGTGNDSTPRSRIEYVQALLRKDDGNWLRRLEQEKNVHIVPFAFDGHTTSQLRKLVQPNATETAVDSRRLADSLSTTGQVTALGAALDDASQQVSSGHLAAVVLVSDFAQNSGSSPLGGGSDSPAARLGVPVYTVGVGAVETVDLAVELQVPPTMKKGERDQLTVKIRSEGLQGQTASIQVVGRRLQGDEVESSAEFVIGQQTRVLAGDLESIEFPFTPDEAGRFQFSAHVTPLPGEVLDQNNRASREATVIDDYLRLMYVAFEPTWEWRFIKEVFHRDKLVGLPGFRTYLSSSDPRVRQSNPLFLPSITPQRREFFAQDVIFLEDLPASSIGSRFPELVKQWVSDLGGGLVVIPGPRFGLRELAQTPLAEMLPVVIDPQARPKTDREFTMQRTTRASEFSFMQLSTDPRENERAWANAGQFSWYQPVANVRESARVLAEHPTDVCRDGRTRQPLIAVREYGKGQVIYMGINETWRLRRRYGEKYYREFWSQLIYRLGIGHALGDAKRFVATLDREQYRVDDRVLLRVEAYDADYEPLSAEVLSEPALTAELITPDPRGGVPQAKALSIPLVKDGEFEARFPVFSPGEYILRIKDPIADRFEEKRFEVSDLSAERRQAVRDLDLQEQLASRTGGRSYDLLSAERLCDDLQAEPKIETTTRNHALWTTPLWFGMIVLIMLGEWLVRKQFQLA